jgi:sugar/nucleoside kinase (ribokinase family)
VVVYGTVAADVVLRVPALPRPGDLLDAEPLGWRLGGSSANVACGLAAAGHRVELIGPVGSDAVAEALVEELERRGVRTQRLHRVDAPSPRALILLDPDGERTILVLNRNSTAAALPLEDLPSAAGADCVYVESSVRFPTALAERAGDALLVATPPAPGQLRWPADVLVGSERQYPEGWLASPYACGLPLAGSRLRWVVVTRGRRGADAYGPDGEWHVAARPAKQVDATGAGDAFTAAFISGILAGHGIRETLELGAAQGAAAVEVMQSVPPGWLAEVEPS